ncbi:MAG: carbohydrate binding family 9 domain-containing protein [Ignavibacterium sp.]
MKHFPILAFALSTLVSLAYPSDRVEPLRPLRTNDPPRIDGVLDDAVWKLAPRVSGFRTFIPDFGKEMPESTHVYMAYDRENLYFAYYCYDPDPSTIKAEVTNRDNIRRHDWICINLDSFNDQQALYGFYVNPLGIQEDSRFAAGGEDMSVDFVWYSAGRIVEDGYIVEVQIPLKSIRYADTNPVEMSVVFERRVSRRSEQATYPPLDPTMGFAFLVQMKPMVFHDIEHYTLLEILPGATYRQDFRHEQGSLVRYVNKGEGSLTMKYGITSDLILDATYNPDFSQVESDAGQVDVNLRSGIFFPEKRPFFLEGNEIFNIAGAGVTPADPLIAGVHTRTIENPLVGVKLSGKIGRRSTIASIYALDEPLAGGDRLHVPVLRFKQALTEDSYLGALLTAREDGGVYNRVAGTDGTIRMSASSTLDYNAFVSDTKYAAGTESLTGHSVAAVYQYGTRDLNYAFGFNSVSRNFNTMTGFLFRTGILAVSGTATPKFYPNSEFLRRIDLTFVSSQTRDEFSRMWETLNYVQFQATLPAGVSFRARGRHSTEVFAGQRFRTDGLLVSGGGQFSRQVNFTASYEHANAIYFPAPFQGVQDLFSATLIYQPWNQFEARLSLTHVSFRRDSDDVKIFEYPIGRARLTYQVNKFLFLRGIAEYNKLRRTLITDYLVSFTYIPGTVLHAGYGSLYQRTAWQTNAYVDADGFLEFRRGFFFKVSYLWRS